MSPSEKSVLPRNVELEQLFADALMPPSHSFGRRSNALVGRRQQPEERLVLRTVPIGQEFEYPDDRRKASGSAVWPVVDTQSVRRP